MRKQKYSLHSPLARISRHDQLPAGAITLGSCLDTSNGNSDRFTLVKVESYLIILVSYVCGPDAKYYCDQYDFPLKTLSWFPGALDDFRKSPSEGGLPAGAMTTQDVDVDGEMMCIQNTTDGYALMNRSRNLQDTSSQYYPVNLSLSWEFLYNLGFLDIWKSAGERYQKGEI